MENKKLTKEEIDRNFELLNEAKAIAKLDNKAKIDAEDLELLNKRATGELTHEELTNILNKKYSRN